MNAYAFPDHVQISSEAKSLIKEILIIEPHMRPTLDGILQLPFFTRNPIPKVMPLSSLAIPPSAIYLKHFSSHDENQPLNSARSLKNTEKEILIEDNQIENTQPLKKTQNNIKENEVPENNILYTDPNKNPKPIESRKVTFISHYQPIENGPEI